MSQNDNTLPWVPRRFWATARAWLLVLLLVFPLHAEEHPLWTKTHPKRFSPGCHVNSSEDALHLSRNAHKENDLRTRRLHLLSFGVHARPLSTWCFNHPIGLNLLEVAWNRCPAHLLHCKKGEVSTIADWHYCSHHLTGYALSFMGEASVVEPRGLALSNVWTTNLRLSRTFCRSLMQWIPQQMSMQVS